MRGLELAGFRDGLGKRTTVQQFLARRDMDGRCEPLPAQQERAILRIANVCELLDQYDRRDV